MQHDHKHQIIEIRTRWMRSPNWKSPLDSWMLALDTIGAEVGARPRARGESTLQYCEHLVDYHDVDPKQLIAICTLVYS